MRFFSIFFLLLLVLIIGCTEEPAYDGPDPSATAAAASDQEIEDELESAIIDEEVDVGDMGGEVSEDKTFEDELDDAYLEDDNIDLGDMGTATASDPEIEQEMTETVTDDVEIDIGSMY